MRHDKGIVNTKIAPGIRGIRGWVAVVLVLGCPMAAGGARAAVYRCTVGGKTVYTDQACRVGASAVKLPALQTVPAGLAEQDMAGQYDRRQKAAAQARKAADAAWLQRHAARKAQQAAIRKGLVEGRVVAGMSPAQVEQVLGSPARRTGSAVAPKRWTYVNGRSRRVVEFSGGVVKRVRARRR